MGGYFSTRWRRERTREETYPLLSLDVRFLKRIGALRPGGGFTVSWTSRGEPSVNIVTIKDRERPRLTLDYKTRAQGEADWAPRKETIWLYATPCNYGGERVWFSCPGCQSRRAMLFSAGGLFRCRACHDLAYSSTREDAMERCNRRIQTFQKRLGGGGYGVPIWEVPEKPVRMHWETHERVVSQLRDEVDRHNAFFHTWVVKREEAVERLLGQMP